MSGTEKSLEQKARDYCYAKGLHPTYDSNYGAHYHAFMAGYTLREKEKIHKALKEVEWTGHHKICPGCERTRGEGHTESCVMKGVSEL
jgi:tRNA A-37 threonylcarbamoyl transferase component Bud32